MDDKYECTVSSVEEAIKILNDIEEDHFFTDSLRTRGVPQKFPFGVWFRGHSRSDYKLDPSIFRKKGLDNYYDETNICIHSALRLPNHQKVYESVFDWLCFMQHYDVPTRVLDWTESILVALYFAVKNNAKKESDGEVVALNARTLNYDALEKYSICTPNSSELVIRAMMARHRRKSNVINSSNISSALIVEGVTLSEIDSDYAKPVAVFPNRWNERMVFQSSVFTVHGGKKYHSCEVIDALERLPDPISLDTINNERKSHGLPPILKYFRIPGDKKQKIEDTLFKLGIHEGSLFPEMDHQSVYLKKLW